MQYAEFTYPLRKTLADLDLKRETKQLSQALYDKEVADASALVQTTLISPHGTPVLTWKHTLPNTHAPFHSGTDGDERRTMVFYNP